MLEDTVAILLRHGLDGDIEDRGGHIKVRFINAHGRACQLILSRTPSCRFARTKNRGLLRRLMRQTNEPTRTTGTAIVSRSSHASRA
jgi:hypothetical protein